MGRIFALSAVLLVPFLGVPAASARACTISDNYVPSCGAWWGVSAGTIGLDALEDEVNREFDIVRHWHGVDQPDILKPDDIEQARDGRYLHYNIEARRFTQKGHPAVPWAQIAAGAFDKALKAQARDFARLGLPVFLTFDHEADQDTKVGVRGTTAEFVDAWRHIHDLYVEQGATNVIWVWVVTGYVGNLDKIAALYPGDAYVDWIAWEAYNASGCRHGQPDPSRLKTFVETLRPFYEWLQTKGARAGIDPDKPYMITEMGSVVYPNHPKKTARWYDDIISTLEKYSQIHAVQLWNAQGRGTCDYRITSHPSIVQTFTQIGHHPYVNPP